MLEDYKDVSVKMSRTGDTYPSLSARTKAANEWAADIFLSIHINAGGRTGYEDFIYTLASPKAKECQSTVKNNGDASYLKGYFIVKSEKKICTGRWIKELLSGNKVTPLKY